MTTESKAAKVFAKYDSVVALGMGKSKGLANDKVDITYEHAQTLLPDEDLINGVIQGDMKASKVIKKTLKALHKPMAENGTFCIAVAEMINIISSDVKAMSKKEKKKYVKKGPNIIVFVFDDVDPADKYQKARNKFLKKYLTALFGEFGITPVTDDKVIKKLFGGKGKKGKKKAVVARVSDFIHNCSKVRISGKGMKLKKLLFTFYAVELTEASIANLNFENVTKDQMNRFIKTLLDVYTNNNMAVCEGMDKKTTKKICKTLKEKNKLAVEAYQSFAGIMTSMDPELKMPKVKNGYTKGKKPEPKMKTGKFADFFTKKKGKNAYMLIMLYAHTAACLIGSQPGSSEYNKLMSGIITSLEYEDGYSKQYTTAAKNWAKGEAAAAQQ